MNRSLPNLLFKSISTAALNATVSPGTLQPWIDEIEESVSQEGKFAKLAVAYLPISPPPFFWDYKCRKCHFWEGADSCTAVKGKISPSGWCIIWLPANDKPAFSWVGELLKGES